MVNTKKGFNKILGRYELPFVINCSNCKKHICDSDFEMDPKLCIRCTGEYKRTLTRIGVPQKEILKLSTNG